MVLGQAHCVLHKGMCPVDIPVEYAKRWSMNAAGVQCTPWSAFGSKDGVSSEHMLPFHCWLQRCLQKQLTFIVVENSPLFPVKLLTRKLESDYVCRYLVFGPEDMGFPVQRRRLVFFAVRKSHFTWVGPSQDEIARNFMQIFQRKAVLTADDLITDTDKNQMSMWKRLGQRRVCFISDTAKREELDLKPLLTQRESARFDEYKKLYDNAVAENPSLPCFVVDLHQNPQHRARCSSSGLFTQVSHGLVYSFSRHWLYTPLELLQAHCWSPPETFLEQFTVTDLHKLTGNGMHLASMSAWLVFCLGNVTACDYVSSYMSASEGFSEVVESDPDAPVACLLIGSASSGA
eukprot:4786421-Amphidinium_carterae.1